MTEMMNLLKTILVVQLFYAFAITLISYSIPVDALNFVTSYSEITDTINLESVSNEVQGSLDSQSNIPVIELGALVFYSGNILIDLLVNFAFAIPEMIGLLVFGILSLLNVDSYIFATVELFAGVTMMVVYVVGLIQLLNTIRSGKTII